MGIEIIPILIGAAAIGLAIGDIAATIFNPQGRGAINPALARFMWRGLRRLERMMVIAGPIIALTVIAMWVLLIALGWALIYWPFLPESFRFDASVPADARDGFITALYVSLVSLGTLGLGDISPTTDWFRVLVPFEALVGFGILTASLTWTLSLYAVLSRRRTLAVELEIMERTEREQRFTLGDLDAMARASMIAGLTDKVIRVRDDLVQFPIVYYFHSSERSSDLSAQIGKAFRIAVRGQRSPSPDVRFHAFALEHALSGLSQILSVNYPGCSATSTRDILVAYAHDHGHEDISRYDLEVDPESNAMRHREVIDAAPHSRSD